MGVRGVAGGVLGVLEVEVAVARAFGVHAVEQTRALGGFHVVDEALFGLEVESHFAAFVVLAPLGVDGLSLGLAGAVGHAGGAHQRGVHVQGDEIGFQAHVLVFHAGVAVEVGQSAVGVVDEAVFGRVLHRCVDAGFAHPQGVGVPARGVGQRRGIGLAQVGVLRQGQGVGGDARVETVGGVGAAQRIEVGAESARGGVEAVEGCGGAAAGGGAVEGCGGAAAGGGAVEAGDRGAHTGGAVAHEGRGGERVGRAGVAAAREQGAGVAGQGE